MGIFDWLKEWSPVLNLVAVIFIAAIVFSLQRRVRLRAQTQNEINELIDWANKALGIANEYFRTQSVTQIIKDRTGKLIEQQFRLEITAMSLNSCVKKSFAEALIKLGSLNRQLNQIDLKDNETPRGLTDEFQYRFFEAFGRLLQALVTKGRKI